VLDEPESPPVAGAGVSGVGVAGALGAGEAESLGLGVAVLFGAGAFELGAGAFCVGAGVGLGFSPGVADEPVPVDDGADGEPDVPVPVLHAAASAIADAIDKIEIIFFMVLILGCGPLISE
jgi:hypothetical protein